jgi:hypothetical protein
MAPSHPAVSEASALAATLGGRVDGGTSKSIVLTVPAATGFDRIVSAVDEWVATHPEFVWQFSNAYDIVDGETPLAWWNRQSP